LTVGARDPTIAAEVHAMKPLLALAVSAVLAVGVCAAGFAADEKTLTPQQERMKDCNAKAGDKKGDERKAFMSSCLKGEAPAGTTAQQQKMKQCNADANAKTLKGDERKDFMKSCLKGDKN
jgi:psiF repeat-containing protein